MVLLLLHVLYNIMYTAKIMNHFSNVFEMNFAYHHLMTLFSVKIWWSKFETYENFSEHCVINIMYLFYSLVLVFLVKWLDVSLKYCQLSLIVNFIQMCGKHYL